MNIKEEINYKIMRESLVDDYFNFLEMFMQHLNNSDWIKGNIDGTMQLNKDTDYLMIMDKSKKRIIKHLIDTGAI